LTTYYSGVRPGTPGSNAYYPMNKKGAVLLGNGGDNGNGSAGTFYEGVMTTGFPTEATTDAVQANIVAAKYDVPGISMSRATSFTPKSIQDVTVTYTNTSNAPAKAIKLSISLPKGWLAQVEGSTTNTKTFTEAIASNASVSATFKIISSSMMEAGFLTAKVERTNSTTGGKQIETTSQRIRNVSPIKINEVRFSTGNNPTNQFIE